MRTEGPDDFSEFYQTFQEEECQIYTNPFRKARKYITTHFRKMTFTKPDQDITRKLQMDTSHENKCKSPQQNISKSNSAIYR